MPKKVVEAILHKWNWDVVDAGGIEKSHYLECLAMLWIDHLFANKFNSNFAFALINAKQ